MFARMLFPTDLTAYSNMLLDCLPEFKPAGLRQVILLNVIRESEVPMGNEVVNEESLARVRWSREESLHVARLALEGKGVSVLTRVEYGSPAQEIVRVADEERVDWVVMGTEGWSAPLELLMGGTLFNVLRRTTVPVLVQNYNAMRELGHTKCREACRQAFTCVLHPTDFSDCAGAAFNVVKRLKAAGTERVILLHVEEEHASQRRPTEEFERMRHDLALNGLPVETIMRHGIPSHETLKVADEENAGVIVLGLHGRSAFQEALSGETLEKIVRQSRKPVLVVRGENSARVTK